MKVAAAIFFAAGAGLMAAALLAGLPQGLLVGLTGSLCFLFAADCCGIFD